MSHPDPEALADRRPIQIGEVWENPITRERATMLELPHRNPERRAAAELLALVGGRVVGEHRHPGLVERFTVLDGELVLKRDGVMRVLRQGDTATIEPNVWHDWWNAGSRDARAWKSRPASASHTCSKHFLASRGSGIPTLKACRIYCSWH